MSKKNKDDKWERELSRSEIEARVRSLARELLKPKREGKAGQDAYINI